MDTQTPLHRFPKPYPSAFVPTLHSAAVFVPTISP